VVEVERWLRSEVEEVLAWGNLHLAWGKWLVEY